MVMEIVSINKDSQKNEHDQMWKGKAVHLDIIAYDDGFMALYYMDVVAEPIPGMSINQRKALVKYFVKERWWHRFVGVNDEKRMDLAVRKLKKRWEDMKDHTTKIGGLISKYGVEQYDDK